MNPDRLHLLIVEDEEAHIEAIRRAYETAGADVEIRSVGTLREFRACLLERPPDLALIDLNLPDGRAVEVLTHPLEDAAFPILVMTAYGNQQIVVEVMKAGALDYVVKSPEAFAAMPRTVEKNLREWKLLQKHKLAEAARQKISAHENVILATIPDIIMEVDNDKVYTWANPAGLAFFGDQVLGRKVSKFFVGEQETLTTVQPLFNGNEQVIYVESWQRRKDGQKRLLAWWSHTLKGPQGQVIGALATARDITEKMQAEEALRESEERFRYVLENVQDAVWSADLSGQYEFLSPIMAHLYGRPLLEIMANPDFWIENVHPADQSMARASNDALFRDGHVELEYRIILPDGTVRWIFDRKILLQGQRGKSRIAGITSDITSRKQAEEALRESEEQYRSILNASPDGILIIAAEGRTLMGSPVAAKMFGFGPEEDLRGRPIDDFIVPEDQERAISNMALLFQGQQQGPIEYRARRADGSTFVMEANAETIRNAEGRPIKMVVVVRDITDRKQREVFRETSREILQILNEPESIQASIQHIIEVLKTRTGADAVGIRLQEGDDFPYSAQQGFSTDFLQTENTLVERTPEGGVCRNPDGSIRLECTCGLVISGKTDPANPGCSKGGSFWTNDSFPFLDLPAEQDPRLHPRNQCIHQGYASVALIPIRVRNRIVGLIHLNDRLRGFFTADAIETLESIAAQIGTALLRKQAESALQKSEEQLRLSLDAANAVAWVADLVDQTVEETGPVDRVFRKPAGFRHPNEAAFFQDIHPDDRARVIAALQTGTPSYSVEYRLPPAEGGEHWLQATGQFENDSTGRPIRLQGVTIDITARKQAEAELRESETRYRSLFDNMVEGFAYCRMLFEDGRPQDFIYLAVNEAFETQTGLKNVTGRKVSEVIPGGRESDPELIARYGRVAMTGQSERFETYFVALKKWFSITVYCPKKEHFVAVFDVITARKQAEEALQKSEQEFHSLAEAMPQIVWVTRADGWNIYFNHQWLDYTGLTLEESYGHGWNTPFHPDDQGRAMEAWQNATQNNETYSLECRLRRFDGTYRWWLVRGVPVCDADGKILKWFGTCTDIEDIKQSEEALRKSEERFKQVAETAEEWIWEMDAKGVYTYSNAVVKNILGYAPEELIGQKNFIDLIAPHVREEIRQAADGRTARQEAFRKLANPVLHKDGRVVILETTGVPIWDAEDRLVGYRGTDTDITARKQAENGLQFSNIILATQQEVSIDGILVVDAIGKITSSNRRFAEMWGVPADIVASKSDENALHAVMEKLADPQEFMRKVKHLYEARNETSRDEIALKDGRTFDRYSAPMCGPDGQYYGRVWYFRDITKHKRAEEVLRELPGRLMQAQDEVRRRIARELHDSTLQDLAAAAMQITLLVPHLEARDGAVADRAADVLAVLEKTMRELRTLTHLLHSPLLDEVGLADALRQYADEFAERSGLTLTVEVDARFPHLSKEVEMALFRVAQEALTNVHRHSGSKTAVIRLRRTAETAVLEIEDFGCGLPPHLQANPGEHMAGAGIGLAGMRERLLQLGGRLELQSGPTGMTVRAVLTNQEEA